MDETAARRAFALLSAGTQASLRERAELTASLGGGTFEPHQMLVAGRFRLRFEPRAYHVLERDDAVGRAKVRVQGATPEQRAEFDLVLEDGGWRIPLELPPAAPPVYDSLR